MQTNPFDLFETFFGASMGGFSGMDQGTFRTRRRSTAVQGEDIRFVATCKTCWSKMIIKTCVSIGIFQIYFSISPLVVVASANFDCLALFSKCNICISCFWHSYPTSVIFKLTQTCSIRYDVILGFTEAIFGTEKDIILSHLETCDTCGGSGSKAGSKMRICSTCGGRGQVMRTEQTPFGLFSQVTRSILFRPLDSIMLFHRSIVKNMVATIWHLLCHFF